MSAKKSKKIVPETNNNKASKRTPVKKKTVKKTAAKQSGRKPNPIPNSKPFPPGVSGNPKGRPPKLLKHVLDELKRKGFERVSPSQVAEAYELLFNLSEAEIAHYVNDKKAPMFMRIVAKRMMSKDGVEMIEKMLNRAHGNTKQTVDTTNTIVLPDLTPEMIKLLNASFDKDN